MFKISKIKLFFLFTLIISGTPLFAAEDNISVAINKVYQCVKINSTGNVADYIPALKKANPNNYGIVIITVDGKVYKKGDTEVEFAIESISKVFTLALALKDSGKDVILENVGAYQTGLPFNSIIAPDIRVTPLQNPLVNAGAIITTSYINGINSEEKWKRTLNLISIFAGKKLSVMEDVFESEMATNQHNRALAWQAKSANFLQGDPDDAVMRYTKACSIGITCENLATMGVTLANSGVNPCSGKRIISADNAKFILSMMMISGLYDSSGPWLLKVGVPGKSGVGGGILAVIPGKFALAVFSPPLDKSGNSVRGVKTAELLSCELEFHLLRCK